MHAPHHHQVAALDRREVHHGACVDVRRRGDLDLGATDASIIGLAERLATDLVITLDRRRFEAVRTPGGRPFDLPPETRRTDETAAPYGSSQG